MGRALVLRSGKQSRGPASASNSWPRNLRATPPKGLLTLTLERPGTLQTRLWNYTGAEPNQPKSGEPKRLAPLLLPFRH